MVNQCERCQEQVDGLLGLHVDRNVLGQRTDGRCATLQCKCRSIGLQTDMAKERFGIVFRLVTYDAPIISKQSTLFMTLPALLHMLWFSLL
jgi:hypothetical protein